MFRRHTLFLGWAIPALLAACSSAPEPTTPTVAVDGMPNAELALDRSLDRIDRAMAELNGLQPVTVGPAPGADVLPAELQRPTSFDWSGPLDEGVRALADRIGYRLIVNAPEKPVPIIVSVNFSNVRALDLLNALGTAAGDRASVTIDSNHQLVKVDHHA